MEFLAALLIAVSPADPEPRALDIGTAVRLALLRSEAVAIAHADVERARTEQARAFSEWLPRADAALSYDRTLASEYENLVIPTVPAEENPFALLPFGRANAWRAGLSVSENLFAGGSTLARQRIADAARRSAEVGLESARAQAALDVADAYYDVILGEELVRVAEESVAQADLTAKHVGLAVKEGTLPDFDLLRARVALKNQQPRLIRARADVRSAWLRLKQSLDIPLDEDVKLTSSLDAAPIDFGIGAPPPGMERAPLRQAREVRAQSDAAADIAWSQHLPRVDVNMSYGYVAYPDEILPAFPDIRDNWTVGVILQLPLFNGFRTTADVDRAHADVATATASLRQTAELAAVDLRIAHQDLIAAEAAHAATAGVVEEARAGLEIARLRLAEGLATILEVRDAQLLREQAEVNRAAAARDLQLARVRVALFPSLPTSSASFLQAGAAGDAPSSRSSPSNSFTSSTSTAVGASGAPFPIAGTLNGQVINATPP